MTKETISRPDHEVPAADLPPPPKSPPPKKSRFGWLWIVFFLALAAAAYYYWPKEGQTTAQTGKGKGGGRRGGAGGGPLPVVATKARRGNIGVYFNGLGAVTPIYTVTVKSRVDGELVNVMYREGDMVKKGDLLMEIDPRPFQVQLEQYEGQLARDQALLNNAKVDLTRYETLLKQNAIPEQQLATQKALVEQDQGIVQSDQGQIDSAKLNLVYSRITAPITGRVGLRLVDPGNIVHAADTNGLVVITQIDPISVIFTIAEDQLPEVLQRTRAGQHLRVDAYDRDLQKRIAQGTLATIDNQIDQTTGTVKLRADFDNKDGRLFPNQFVNARLLVQEKTGVVLLNSAALQRAGTNTYVFLVKPDSSVTIRNVMAGTTEGTDTEITSGLEPNDVVVMTGVDKLQEGTKVNAQIDGQPAFPDGASGNGGQGKGRGRGKGKKSGGDQ